MRAGETLLGTMVTLPTPAIAEILADVGFDWLFIDGEHGPLETGEILAILQAVGDRVACVVRVPAAEEASDQEDPRPGCRGDHRPAGQHGRAGRQRRPLCAVCAGRLAGVGLARAHGYGMRFQEYLETANERVAVIVQAEHARAVENIESIVKVEGIDAVFIGPYDLAASLGKMGRIDDPAVTDAIDHVTRTCQAAGIPLGYFGVSAAAIRPYMERGYTLIAAGVDTLFLAGAAKKLLDELR